MGYGKLCLLRFGRGSCRNDGIICFKGVHETSLIVSKLCSSVAEAFEWVVMGKSFPYFI
jgi:hypothetical protein